MNAQGEDRVAAGETNTHIAGMKNVYLLKVPLTNKSEKRKGKPQRQNETKTKDLDMFNRFFM